MNVNFKRTLNVLLGCFTTVLLIIACEKETFENGGNVENKNSKTIDIDEIDSKIIDFKEIRENKINTVSRIPIAKV